MQLLHAGTFLAAAAVATNVSDAAQEARRQTTSSASEERSWPNLIPKRRTIPPYDRYRYALVIEWDPFTDLPPAALQSGDIIKQNTARKPTPRPTDYPTQYGVDILDQMPPTRKPGVFVPQPTPMPTYGPTTLDEWETLCGVDGYGFLSTVTLKDKWGDGWDGAFLTIRDSITQEPVYSGTLRGNDGRERTEYVCLKVWKCYEVVVTGSQWSDEISWSIDRLETNDYFLLMVNNNNNWNMDQQLAFGVANQRCTFAITDVNLMDEECLSTCDGGQHAGTVIKDDDDSEGEGNSVEEEDSTTTTATNVVKQPYRRPTVAPTPVPTVTATISDDFGTGGGGRQPTIPVGFGGNTGGTGTAQRPTSNFPFTNPFNPFDQSRPVTNPGGTGTTGTGTGTTGTGTGTTGTGTGTGTGGTGAAYDGSAAVTRGTPRPTPSPTTPKPTLPPAFNDPNMPYRPPGYYNYDPFDGYYGPHAWSKWFPGCGVGVTSFDQTGVGIASSVGDGRQAPIHLGEGMNVECEATHEIRTRAAEFSICDEDAGLFSITPSRLRLDFTAKKKNPETDLPDGFGSMTAKYLEVSYPALHTIEEGGRWKRYDAEYTIVHDFDRREKATLVSILIDASGNKNERFQDLLDIWSKVDTCRTPRNEEQFQEQIHQFDDRRNLRAADSSQKHRERVAQRDLACAFNIYHRSLMPSTYYYAYQGSLPEPPCTYKDYLPGTSEWRVINKPMEISSSQLEQLKTLIEFGPCKDDEYARDLGLWRARPVQESNERPYWQCKRDDFPLDCEKDGGWCDCDAILCAEDFE